uniref:CCHC-type domain-containing protein n=1 Tax=Octopus bimaculoides TaxID=37653 RepID=A0A0L8FKL1_OCTBM
MESYARAAAAKKPVPLETKLIKLDIKEVNRSKNVIEVEGDSYKLFPPKETKEDKILRTVVYRTQAVETCKIEMVTEEGIEECLGEIVNESMYINRGRKFGTVEMRFATIEKATKHATTILKTPKIALLPSYRERRSVRIRIPRVPPEIKPKWLVATVLAATKEDPELGPVAETKLRNWWGFEFEMWLFATFEDIERIPYQIEVADERTLIVVVEGRKPNCYICGERGHMKTKCPLYEFTHPQQEKTQAEEENIVDHTEEKKERQKYETEKTKEKNENGASNPKKGKKNKSKERSTESKKEIGKPETNNVQEEEERTDKDVKGVLIKYEKSEQMERKIAKLEEIMKKTQAEEENIVDHTEEKKERQKYETEKTKEKNENGASNPKKGKKNKSKERSTESKKEIGKPETNNVQEEEERTDKDVKGVLIKYEKSEQMERKIAKLEEIMSEDAREMC